MKTNADKYLKEGVSVEKMANELATYLQKQDKTIGFQYYNICQFLMKSITPTLTEDERAILRNIDKQYKFIYRDKFGDLHLDYVKPTEDDINCTYVDDSFDYFDIFDHLFQFIKERRRIFNRRTIEIRYAHLPSSRRSLRISIEMQTLYVYVGYLKGVDNYGNLYYRRLSSEILKK